MIRRIILKLREITVGFQIFQVFRFGFLLLITIVFAHILDGKSVIAEYEKLILFGAILTSFWVSGIFNSFVPLYHDLETDQKRVLVSQTFVVTVLLALISAGGILVLGWVKMPPESLSTLLWFAVFMLFNTSSYLVKYFIVVNKRSFLIMGYGIFIYFLHFLLIVLPLALGYTLHTSMQLMAAFGAGKFIFQLIYVRKSLFPITWDKTLLKRQFQLAWPLMVALLMSSYAPLIDAFLVESYLSDEFFAIFQYGAKELPLVMLLANALSVTQSGEVTEAVKKGHAETAFQGIRKTSGRYMHLLFPLSMVLLLGSDVLYEWVYSGKFSASPRVFDLYLLLIIPRLLFPQTIIKGHLKTKILSVTSGIELGLNVALSLLFMFFFLDKDQPMLALQGIAMATLIAYTLEKFMLLFWCRVKLKIRAAEYTKLGIWLIYSLVLAAMFVAKFWYIYK